MDKRRTADRIAEERDRALAASALTKRERGETPSDREIAGLGRWERRRWKEAYELVGDNVPKGTYQDWSGRAWKILHEQARLYGVPVDGPTVNVPAVVRFFHDFLAEHGRKILQTTGEDPMSGPTTPALERWRMHKADLAELDVEERRGILLRSDVVNEKLQVLASILRQAGEALQKEFGPKAQAVLDEAFDDFEHQLTEWLGDGDGKKT